MCRPIQASTGRVQGMTSCHPCSPCVQLVARTIFGQGEWKFEPCHFPFQERKFHVILALGSESSMVPPMELLLPGAKVRGNKTSSYHDWCWQPANMFWWLWTCFRLLLLKLYDSNVQSAWSVCDYTIELELQHHWYKHTGTNYLDSVGENQKFVYTCTHPCWISNWGPTYFLMY